MKPYRTIPILECGEPLHAIPADRVALTEPHPYIALGLEPAYGGRSPWRLRISVVAALMRAATRLEALRPGWTIRLHDAWRPNAVQAAMVEHEKRALAVQDGLNPDALTPEQDAALLARALRIWAIPSDDPATPPPHSTGGALDCTLQDSSGQPVFMGSPLDENSERSVPEYFATAGDEAGRMAQAHRQLLATILCAEGFQRHPAEWWHFCLGDQMWAWREREQRGTTAPLAIYGRTS